MAALHFGAGNIGRGFIGPVLVDSGYRVIFADVQPDLVEALNDEDSYQVHILDNDGEHQETVKDVSGVLSNQPTALTRAFLQVSLVTTSVGPDVLEKIAPGIAKGISRRREAGSGPLNVIACENLIGATEQLRDFVEKHLQGNPADLAYIQENVGFANCSVDRIVPTFKNGDPLDVGVEGYYEWIIDRTALKKPLPELKGQGVKFSENLDAYIERKLFTLNTGHAMLAYLGSIYGYTSINEAVRDTELKEIVTSAMRESGNALVKKHGFNPTEHEHYIQKVLTRFENPNVKDEVARVSRNPLRKLREHDRLVGPVRMANEYSLPRDSLLKGVAAALLHDEPDDEESAKLNKLIEEIGLGTAIERLTGFKQGEEEFEKIVRFYKEFKNKVSSHDTQI